MENMILIAGLAIAGLAGIAAAFYFSVRPGNGSSRGRTAGSGRPETDRIDRIDRSADRGRTLAAPSSSRPSRGGAAPGAGRTRPAPDDDFEGPPRRHTGVGHLAAGRRVHRDDSAGHMAPVGARSAGAGTRPRPAERPDLEADEAADAIRSGRGRRRVGFRKGAEVDEELWPTENFGGVSDEQFWDDMASDKPLATTARTAAPADPASRRRLPDIAPVANGRDADDRGRYDASRGSYPPPAGRPGPTDRTASQPIQTSPQRIQTGAQPIPTGPQAIPTGTQPIQIGTQPVPVATRSYQPGAYSQPYQGSAPSYQPATQPAPAMGATGAMGAMGQGTRGGMPAEAPRGRARHASGGDSGAGAGAGEDPLTSAAYAQRPPGAVDGRSYSSPRRSRDRDRDLTREQYEAAVSQDTQSFTLSDAQAASGGYPSGVPPYRQYELPASGGSSGPNGLNGNGNGNGRAPEYRPDAGRSDTGRSDTGRSDTGRSDAGRSEAGRYDGYRSDPYWSGGRPDPLRSAGTADPYGSTTNGHPYPERPYGDQAPSVSTPPYGETYGYGYPVSPADDPRQPNGTRGTSGQGRSGVNGGGTGAYPAYPAGNGYRGSYDPRANGRG
jgi:hypothetical protein